MLGLSDTGPACTKSSQSLLWFVVDDRRYVGRIWARSLATFKKTLELRLSMTRGFALFRSITVERRLAL